MRNMTTETLQESDWSHKTSAYVSHIRHGVKHLLSSIMMIRTQPLKSSGSCFTALIKKQIQSCGFRSADLWLFWVYCVLCLTASCTGFNFFLHIVFCCVLLYVVALPEQEVHRVWWLPEGLRLPFHYRKQCWKELFYSP